MHLTQQALIDERGLDCELNTELPSLIQLLHNEKMAPELLPYQEKLVLTLSKIIGEQERGLQETFQASREADDRFYANILKMEIERAKYALKSYLRARIVKIERHLLWIVEKDQSHLLSAAEMNYAFSLYEARKTHLN